MELTQRLDCTQQTSKISCPEQIGFLGICGTKYPVVKGPNKIGRDPQICNIVLNYNSISRQHAVLNVLSKNNYMLMDLDSANKTKLQDKTLDPYIPQALHDGDTVQFGDQFGIFRLLEEETDLPMTQVMEIPETPIIKKHMSKINHTAIIPESPEVSDRDDSFITPSQPQIVKSSNNNVVKPSGKSILIQRIGKNIIDNIYWKSSKKSDSFAFDSGLKNVQIVTVKSEETNQKSINAIDTQVTDKSTNLKEDNMSIYEANTQLPVEDKPNYSCTNKASAINGQKNQNKYNESYNNNTSIFEANTQIPDNFYDMETQIQPDNLPNVCKIETLVNMQNQICGENKDNIFEAETQQIIGSKMENKTVIEKNKGHETSDDVILFDEIDSQCMDDNLDSQAILPPSPCINLNAGDINDSNTLHIDESNDPKKDLTSSTDCDDIDILPSQVITTSPKEKGDNIDGIDILPTQVIEVENNININPKVNLYLQDADDDITDCEDNLDQNLETTKDDHTKFADLPTQIISDDQKVSNDTISCNFNEMLTQVLVSEEDKTLQSKVLKQINTIKDSFKVPKPSPRKLKKKQINQIENYNKASAVKNGPVHSDDDSNYYAATQDILGDLCTQPDPTETTDLNLSNDSGCETKINEIICGLSSQEVRDIVGVEKVSKLKRFPSDSSDCESTPSKPFKLTYTDLPNSQEIKTSISAQNKTCNSDFSSDSESEKEPQEGTPILFKKKKKTNEVKLDLLRKIDADALPSRISMRVKKNTEKYLNNYKSTDVNRLKSNYIPDQEENIDTDIVTENILRLKSVKTKKSVDTKGNVKKESKTISKEPEIIPKQEKRIRNKIEEPTTSKESKTKRTSKSKDDKETIKVKILKPAKRGRPRKEKAEGKVETSDDGDSSIRHTRSHKPKENPKGILKRYSSPNDLSNHGETEPIRRSRRRKFTKDCDESEVYSSSCNSPAIKRQPSPSELPAKKYKPATSLGLTTNLRATPARRQKTHYVLFTAFPVDEVKSQLESLGAVLVSDVKACTVVLTLQIKRTFKLLCAVGLGKPIVGRQWVQACVDNNVIVEPWSYLIQDEVSEQRFNFNLERTLLSKRNFLKGFYVSSTPNVLPNAHEMKLIVESSGGKWKEASECPKSKWLVISSPVDKALWPAIKKKGGIIVSNELVLGGVLRQTLDIERNRLD